MKKSTASWTTAGLAILLAAWPALGQDLPTGVWSGTVSPPDQAGFDVSYEVSYDDEGALKIDLIPPAGLGAPASIPFESLEFEDGSLTFSWFGGTALTCELTQQEDGSFEGECVDTGGTPGILVMVPPEALREVTPSSASPPRSP
ncbi:MAG: hypothetical protein OEU54_06810 [Gemmatimonadota bacterium]|nr:hypothetical protein [Gemmatimonadota bacterium]